MADTSNSIISMHVISIKCQCGIRKVCLDINVLNARTWVFIPRFVRERDCLDLPEKAQDLIVLGFECQNLNVHSWICELLTGFACECMRSECEYMGSECKYMGFDYTLDTSVNARTRVHIEIVHDCQIFL